MIRTACHWQALEIILSQPASSSITKTAIVADHASSQEVHRLLCRAGATRPPMWTVSPRTIRFPALCQGTALFEFVPGTALATSPPAPSFQIPPVVTVPKDWYPDLLEFCHGGGSRYVVFKILSCCWVLKYSMRLEDVRCVSGQDTT